MGDRAIAYSYGVAEVVGKGLVVVRHQVGLLQEPAAGADFSGKSGDRLIGAVEARVVVVDEVAEQPVLPLRDGSEAERDCLGVDELRVDRLLDFKADPGAEDDDGM